MCVERGEIEMEELRRTVKARGAARAIGSLVRRGLLARTYRLARPPIAPKVVPHLRLLVAAHRSDDLVLKGSEELGLQRERHIRDLVQE
jgi:hypothetical protein